MATPSVADSTGVEGERAEAEGGGMGTEGTDAEEVVVAPERTAAVEGGRVYKGDGESKG